MEVGEQNTGKPGKPYIVTISFIGYLAKEPEEAKNEPRAKTIEEVNKSLNDMTLHKPAPDIKFGLEELGLTAPETIIEGQEPEAEIRADDPGGIEVTFVDQESIEST